jgi:hypothetical protein
LSDRYRANEAEPLLRHALAIQRRQPVPDHAALAETLETLSFIYSAQIKPRLAEPLAREAFAQARLAWGEQDSRSLRLLNEMGTIKAADRDYAAAASIFRRVIALNDQVQPGGLGSIAPQINLCICLFNEERLAELEPVVSRLERDTLRLVGPHGMPSAIATAIRGCLEFAQADYQAAIPHLRAALDTLASSYPPGQTTVVQCRALLGLCLTRTGHAAEGEPFLRQALANGGKVDKAEFAHTFGNLETAMGECLLAQNRYGAAEPPLLTGYQELQRRLGPQNRFTLGAARRLHDLYTAWNKPSQANQFVSFSSYAR